MPEETITPGYRRDGIKVESHIHGRGFCWISGSVKPKGIRVRADTANTGNNRYCYPGICFAGILIFSMFFILGLSASSADAQEAKRVLILNSYHKGNPWTDGIVEGIQSVFDKVDLFSITVHVEFMDTKRHKPERIFPCLKKLYREKYRTNQPDIIILSDNNALDFILKYRDELFPDVPVVFCGINNFTDSMLDGHTGITGIVEDYDLRGTIELILRLHPHVKQVACITDIVPTGKLHRQRFRKVVSEFSDDVEFVELAELTATELGESLSRLPHDSAVILLSYYRDRTGEAFTPQQAVSLIAEHNLPIYSCWDIFLNTGIVGGILTNCQLHGEHVAQMALRILGGESADSIPVIYKGLNVPMFDYLQLKRWGIKLSNLPEGSIVINKPHSFYEEKKRIIWSVLAFITFQTVIIFSLLLNMSRRKRAEMALQKSEEKYRGIIANAVEGIYRTTIDGEILEANSALLEFLGYESLEELKAANFSELFLRPADRDRFLKELLKRGHVKGYEVEYRRRDGKIVVATESARMARKEDGTQIIEGILYDVTEHKQMEEQLRQAQKMEAIGTLATGVAHDFNNILQAIQGYTDIALLSVTEGSQLYRDLNQIRKASMCGVDLTRQLLLFSRRQHLEMVSLNVNRVIQDLTKMLNRLVGEDVSLTADFEPEIWTVEANAGNFGQMIMNLVVNARDAMPEGGEITIKTRNVHVDEEYCRIYRVARPGKFVHVSVKDTGVGMDQAVIDRIFDPFFTTKGPERGTGMGLAVVYGIVKEHGGWITVESSPGNGAVFSIYLPACTMKSEEEKKASVSSEPFRGNGERILLVEDDESVRESTTKWLSKNGYAVFGASGVQEALDIFQKNRGNFDLILADVILPDGRGPKLVQHIVRLKPEISVLFVSGYSGERSDWSSVQKGGYPYLQKPYFLTDLLKVVSDTLKKK